MNLLQENTSKRELLTTQPKNMKIEGEDKPNMESSMPHPVPQFPLNFPTQDFLAQWLTAAAVAQQFPLPNVPYSQNLFFRNWNMTQTAAALELPMMMMSKNRANKLINNNNIVTSSSEKAAEQLKKEQGSDSESLRLKTPPSEEPTSPMLSPSLSLSPPSSVTELGTKDSSRDKQFTCGVCNRSFGYKHVLQNHERTHTGEKPFECPECHKRFTRDHHLKTHMRLHTGERPYHCEHCDRHFVQVANLRRHLRVHTGERPYACEWCSAKFSDSNQLKAHLLIHTNAKPFSCDKCNNRFRRRHHLVHHKCTQATTAAPVTPVATTTIPTITELPKLWMPEQSSSPILTSPKVEMRQPEQTEPEDLSMSTGMHSRSTSSISTENDDEDRST